MADIGTAGLTRSNHKQLSDFETGGVGIQKDKHFLQKIGPQGNVVIGSRNNLSGNNHWVFDSDVKTVDAADGVLIIENYLI